ncbi:MAG: hypothetical protein HFH70_04435 [Lachnospiraceae bacterium]|nr:hypothetical protein [Lachnospiraceae bacterium]
MACKKKTIIFWGIGIWAAGLMLITIVRIFYDIEITDEAYYIAEANLVLEGNLPYVYDSQIASGFTFLMLPFVKIYKFLVPSLEGIFLYMRICFYVFYVSILVISYFLLCKVFDKNHLIVALSMFIPFWGASIPNFSYNTISVWLVFLIGVINVSAMYLCDYRGIKVGAVLSGILMAIAEFAHPMEVLNVFYVGILIFCFGKKGKRWKPFLYYIGSGLLAFLIIMSAIVVQCGFQHLLFGLDTIFNYKIIREIVPISTAFKSLLVSFKYEFVIIFISVIGTVFGGCVRNKGEKNIHLINRYAEKGLLLGIIFSLLYIFIRKTELEILLSIGIVSGIAIVFWLFFIVFLKERENNLIFFFLMMPSLFLFVLNGFFTACNIYDRVYEFVPALFGMMLILGKDYFHKKGAEGNFVIAGIMLVAILLIRFDYSYIYRGNPINELKCRIETGIYRGVYTTEEKARDIIKLESYIRENTEKEEKVLFMEVVPMAYLMSKGKGCAPSSWDIMQYSYGYNNPSAIYRYFENRNQIPDKIIYIDTGRDEQLSIETDYYKFNDFVNENYVLSQEDSVGQQFRVKVYKLSGDSGKVLESISSLY